MSARSWLFVPADSEKKLAKSLTIPADVLILDLEDSVTSENKPRARALVKEVLGEARGSGREAWVRINPIDTPDAVADLDAVLPSGPVGIVLPKPASAAAVVDLDERLEKLEEKHSLTVGSTRILALCTEQPRALFTLPSYIGASERLAGLTWGAEDLAAALGAASNRDSDGNWLPVYELARSFCLLAAAAAEVAAFDTVYTDFKDTHGLRQYAERARRDGFLGMLAIHPAQVEIINRAFTPRAEELARARRIVELFASDPSAGTIGMDGEMIDRPHLIQAKRLLAAAENFEKS